MKKVVHLTSAHTRYDQRILWRECCSLQEHGYDVTLIVNDDQESERLKNGVSILSTGFVPDGRKDRMTGGVWRVYELGIAQDADIYHLHDPELLWIALNLKNQGKKVIFDSHETYGENIKEKMWIPALMRQWISLAYNTYEGYVCRRIDGVIHVGQYDGKDWFFGRSKRFVYVGNFPKLEEFESVPVPEYCARANVCFSGGIAKEFGALTMLRAAGEAKTKLVLAGKFTDDGFQNAFFACDKYHVVQYYGMLDRRKIFELYAKCAVGICVLPDMGGQLVKIANFNTKVYEYMAMEMPVILSDWPYKRKMIETYKFGLVANPNDVNDIAEKIRWLLDHPHEAEEMGKNGKRLLKEQFTWDVAEKELLRLYKEIEES